MKFLISFFKKLISIILSFFTLYVLLLILAPSIGPKVDSLTNSTFSTTIQKTISDFFGKLGTVKEDIDKSIDEAGANTKLKKKAEIDEINKVTK